VTLKPKVALSKEFLSAYSDLPLGIQKKVREFTEKFQANPTQSGINFERLQGVRDDKVRSVRIDQAYRAIVIHPPKGDVFLCVWVARHDDAYAWVRNKRFDVNPTSGVLQLYEVESRSEPAPEAPAAVAPRGRRAEPPPPAASGLFAASPDETLILAGVPAPLLPAVRALRTESDLDAIKPHLPEDAAEVLYGLAAGMPLGEALAEVVRASSRTAAVDVDDFATALAEPASQRQFRVVEGDADLAAMLDRPLAQWRVFLHPTQQRLVTMQANGPVRVLGGPGTGKTVVLMHRARHLAQRLAGDRKVLVTTFTTNLAQDLADNLRTLCGPELARIEVANLHAWTAQFLRRNGVRSEWLVDQGERQQRMDAAIDEIGDAGLPRAFFLEEWQRVVQAQDLLTRDAYLQARRIGRGQRVDRATRTKVWEVFARYRQGLERDRKLEMQDAVREARLLLEKNPTLPRFAAVCADEVQDFTATELRLLRALAPPGPDDLFLVGDAHQRIYGQPVVLSQCGIDVRGRSRRLRLNYRSTDRIAKRGLAIVRNTTVDDLDGGTDTLAGYTSLRRGREPEVRTFADEAAESAFVVERVRGWLDAGVPAESICVAARTKRLLKSRYLVALQQARIPCTLLDGDGTDAGAGKGVRVATVHRMKGIEFPCVLIAGVDASTFPLAAAVHASDAATSEQQLQQERSLLYVACTRARDELVIAGYGAPSPFLT
jgi:superfamily I DNA/RNA helicase